VAIVPYGIDESWLQTSPDPMPGRVLFVGSVGLLKGNHYLAAAARSLANRNPNIEIRVVGPVSTDLARMSLFAGPRYVGQIPRASVQKEFLAADVFVLPTLCEGFGLVHLEALASGVPVITTPNCGSVVRDTVDGFIVPTRDPVRLAEVIEHIVSDRNLRARMSKNARLRASQFTWTRYGERLIDAVGRLQSPSHASPAAQPEFASVAPLPDGTA
jgi:glycosyltransferase involved in cell wall biosynthesis